MVGSRERYENPPWWRHALEIWHIGQIPKFYFGLQAEEFLDWQATVEDILEFKMVNKDKSPIGGDEAL